ncbi:acyl-CoA carboxylase subunit epsilon [Kitasatospora azatica]|uniref:acyl-CoA carboxylase subunit epsilon n=1 Tax=Kitasatospora azatica TaxID=58347 RepID=UPI00055E8A4A|nr:acyl-CoA carboxylase subunit epsilon [Kitasatospora azatica]
MPPIQVLHGQPTPEELATVLAVVQARAAATQAALDAARSAASGPASPWTDRSRTVRPALRPGAHAWRTSGWAQ